MRKELVTLQYETQAIQAIGKSIAEAKALSEAAIITKLSDVKKAKKIAEAGAIEAETERYFLLNEKKK